MIIGKSLGHKDSKSTMIYSRLDLDPVRSSLNTATGAMLKAAGIKRTGNLDKLGKGSKRRVGDKR